MINFFMDIMTIDNRILIF